MKNVKPSITPYFRLNPHTEWQMSEQSSAVVVDPITREIRLGKAADFPIRINEPYGTFGGKTLPRGVSVSSDGRCFLADPNNNRVLYFDRSDCNNLDAVRSENISEQANASDPSELSPFRSLWAEEDEPESSPAHAHPLFSDECASESDLYTLAQPRDVLFYQNQLLVADSGHHRLLVYLWPELRVRHVIDFGSGEPWAMAIDAQQRLFVADPVQGCIHCVDALWQIDSKFDNGAGLIGEPVAVAVDRENRLLVLNREGAIWQYEEDRGWSQQNRNDVGLFLRTYNVPPLQLDQNTLVYPQSGRALHEASLSCSDVTSLNSASREACEKWRLEGVNVDKAGRLRGTSLPLMARAKKVRLPRIGEYISQTFDNGTPASQWHRVVLDVEIPTTTRVLVSTHTSDRPLSDYEVSDITWSEPVVISTDVGLQYPELLVQSLPGRYLRLRIQLLGDGFTTPVIRAIDIFGPRQSSLAYLPPLFQQDPESAFFLDRLLSYFDTVQAEVRYLLHDFTRYLDPASVPSGEFLEWLGSWFDWQFLSSWPVDVRRTLIRQSIDIYRQRGTLKGIQKMLQWHTGLDAPWPQIIEHYRLRHLNHDQANDDVDCERHSSMSIGETPLLAPNAALEHRFTVVVPSSVVCDSESFQQLERVIHAQKPAHTHFQICVIDQGIRIGAQSAIGIDTWLGYQRKTVLGDISLGQSSELLSIPSHRHISELGRHILN